MPTELGVHNPRVERVRDLQTARGRRDQSRFAIEGATLIGEAQRSGLALRELYVTTEALGERPELEMLESAATPIFTLTPKLFARISDLDTPTGLLAVVDLPVADPQAIVAGPGTVLLLAGVNDPGNAGTLLRSAEAFGAAGVLVGRGSVDPFSPKVVRAAMGSLFRLPIATVDAAWLVAAAAATQRTLMAADTDGVDIADIVRPAKPLLAIGNERRGVHDWLPQWDVAVRIPQLGPAESLNAAVAGSILLYVLSRPR